MYSPRRRDCPGHSVRQRHHQRAGDRLCPSAHRPGPNNSGNAATTTAARPFANQAQLATKIPGRTQIFASAGNNNSDPQDFTTCPVQSISLSVSTTGGTIINAAKGTSNTINATVVDTASQILGN